MQAGTVILADRLLEPGYVVIDGDRITEVTAGRHPRPDLRFPDGALAPGFIDIQINGAAGCDFLSPTEEGLAAAGRHLLATGTVAYLPTLISSPEDRLRAALSFFAAKVRHPGLPRIPGVHLEGPFLSGARPGAHRPSYLRTPSIEWIGRLLDDFRGLVRVVTLAPELDGALDIIRYLCARGLVTAVGHTDATFEQAAAAFHAGARLATHLFNAMRPLHHREPGIVGAALEHSEVACSLIADLVHVHPAVLRLVIAQKGPRRTVLVTDAIAAAGASGGRLTLGDLEVRVEDGAPRLADGTLAGSVLAMDQAVRNIAVFTSLPAAARMAAQTPARLLRLESGTIAPTRLADLVVLDARHQVVMTMVGGEIAYQRDA